MPITTSTTTTTATSKTGIIFLILLGIGVIIALFVWFKKPTVSKTDAQINAKFDSLAKVDQAKLDSLSSYYSKKIDSLNHKIDSAYDQISDNNTKINNLEKSYQKQTHVIDSYDADQLQHLLSNY
jgi:hypothetical protein